jgi:hypothetical protein
MGNYWTRVAATLMIVFVPASLGVCSRASAQTARVPSPTVQTVAVDELLVEKQQDIALRKMVLNALRVLESQDKRLNNLEGRVDGLDVRLIAAENELVDINRLLESEGKRILGKASSPVTSRNAPATMPAPAPTSTRTVLATFPTGSQRAGSKLVAIDGAMFVESTDTTAPAPVVMVGTICPHCVRTGSVTGIGGSNYGVYYQGCKGRYLMVLDR